MRFNNMIASSFLAACFALPAAAQEMPDDQTAFVAAIATARDSYQSASNDLVKSSERKTRAKEICEVVGKTVEDWVGEIYELTTNGDGNAVVTVEMEGDIWIGTYNNSLSDIGSDTLILSDSELFTSLASMSTGQKVKFSGAVFKAKDNQDCLMEKSLTEAGSMTEPEFLIRFSDVAAIE